MSPRWLSEFQQTFAVIFGNGAVGLR
jgi:hypothetical protein